MSTAVKKRPTVQNKPKTVKKNVIFQETIYKLKHADWMSEYRKDKDKGHVILIDNIEGIDQRTMEINKNGLFTPRFKIPVNTDENIIEYSCECKATKGRYYEGEVCQECGTMVESQFSADLARVGWIDIAPYFVISSAIYKKLASYIGPSRLLTIIAHHVEKDTDGHELDLIRSTDIRNPFVGIGLVELKRRYVEIIDYFERYSKKPEIKQILLDNLNVTFADKIPVLSSVHRPAYLSPKAKKLNYHTINASFTKILTNFQLIKSGKLQGRKAIELMASIQQDVMDIYLLTIKKLNGKTQIIRGMINSGRLNYSSRAVIVAETERNNIDEVRMSYRGMIGLYELEIINLMRKGYGNPLFQSWTAPECVTYIKKCKYSREINPHIYKIIKTLIHDRKDDGLYVAINRNPTFDMGSILTMRIADVFPIVSQNILTIPLNSLVGMNADFDGDVLNIFALKEKQVVDAFKKAFLPSKLIMDKTGGYYNKNMTLVKDQYAYLRCFVDDIYKPKNAKKVKLKPIEKILSFIDEKQYPRIENLNLNDFIFISNQMLNEEIPADRAAFTTPFDKSVKYKDGEYVEMKHKFTPFNSSFDFEEESVTKVESDGK